jgi:endonuclease YncB( thermonuclease family)
MAALTAVAGTVLGVSGALFAVDLTGQATVIDGDTLEIHGTRIRLWGIDAPESEQLCRGADSLQYRCGAKAANDLAVFIAGRPVTCMPVTIDRYGRTVASCAVSGVDLADWLVRQGLALDWPRYSKGRYATAQGEARSHEREIWSGSSVEPWRFRDCIRLGGRPASVFG